MTALADRHSSFQRCTALALSVHANFAQTFPHLVQLGLIRSQFEITQPGRNWALADWTTNVYMLMRHNTVEHYFKVSNPEVDSVPAAALAFSV
jgi:hypothetical protein